MRRSVILFTIVTLVACGRFGYESKDVDVAAADSGVLAPDAGGETSGDAAVARLGGQLISGWHHVCLMRADTLQCWGDGSDGQFGNGNYEYALSPFKFTSLAGLPGPITDITGGNHYGCALSGGDAYCWGENKYGELGTSDTSFRESPARVIGLPNGQVTAIAGSLTSTCAIASGLVYCWGRNQNGQLGIGTYQDSDTAQPVLGIDGAAVALTTGSDHACAITENRSVFCWGHDDNGALGVGQYVGDSTVALPSLLTGAEQVSIASVHACGLADGAVYCWGTGSDGELGDGNYSDSNAPVPVTGLGDSVTAMFTAPCGASKDASCAIRAGVVYCWGSNDGGRLGNGSTENRGEPSEVWLPAPAVAIAGGAYHACALLEDDTVWCWGSGDRGQLGDGTGANSYTPVQVSLL